MTVLQSEQRSAAGENWPRILPSPRPLGGADALSVSVFAEDPVSQAGITAQLRDAFGLRVIVGLTERSTGCDVAVVVGATLDASLCATVRRLRSEGTTRVVIVAGSIDETGLFAAVEAGACGVLRRGDATPERLTRALRAAASGDGSLPPDLLGKLLDHVQGLQSRLLTPRGLRLSGLTDRETDVLRLVADGYDTREIADELCYSERTVKNVIHDITTRLQLRNRAHAVAYAVRQGLI